jgi:LPXTG-motif cell wall-anchored protein
MKRALLVVVGAVALTTVVPIAAGVASAHNNELTGVPVCEANGTYTVNWTIGNNFDGPVTVTVTGWTPDVSTVSGPTDKIPGLGSGAAVQSGIPGTSLSASLSVRGVWDDGNMTDGSNSVKLDGTCGRVRPHAIPVAPKFREGTCTEQPSVDAPETDDYAVTITGTVGFGSSVTVTFSAKGDVVLDGDTVFPHTFLAQPDNCATTTTAPGDSTPTTTPATVDKTLTFQVLGPICVADHPYIHWELTSTGLLPSQNLATITITDVNGNVVETLTNQPLVGSTLWPGASLDPQDWPGWVKIGGIWYTDPSDAVLRQGVNVRADINPTAGPLFVAYPEATAACAQPTAAGEVDAATATTLAASLPVTGSSSSATLWIAAGLIGLGGLAMAAARRRRAV